MTLQGILEILLFLIINKLNHSNSKEISNDYDMQLVSELASLYSPKTACCTDYYYL